MKVFLSWSGQTSHKVATTLREWIPLVIHSAKPYVSSEDIDKGTRWSTDIAKELEDSTFGIICVTKDNLNAPWLTFEAGALSKKLEKAYVSPFLFGVKRAEIDGPILQFQSTIFNEKDVKKLLTTLNKACGENKLPESTFEKVFKIMYPNLEKELNIILNNSNNEVIEVEEPESYNQKILEEILELSRINQKILKDPKILFPPEYFDYILKERTLSTNEQKMNQEKNRYLALELEHRMGQFKRSISAYKGKNRPIDNDLADEFDRIIEIISKNSV